MFSTNSEPFNWDQLSIKLAKLRKASFVHKMTSIRRLIKDKSQIHYRLRQYRLTYLWGLRADSTMKREKRNSKPRPLSWINKMKLLKLLTKSTCSMIDAKKQFALYLQKRIFIIPINTNLTTEYQRKCRGYQFEISKVPIKRWLRL